MRMVAAGTGEVVAAPFNRHTEASKQTWTVKELALSSDGKLVAQSTPIAQSGYGIPRRESQFRDFRGFSAPLQ
jgi:hypothetical protein